MASENFARYPAASGLRSRSGCFGGVGCCGELHSRKVMRACGRSETRGGCDSKFRPQTVVRPAHLTRFVSGRYLLVHSLTSTTPSHSIQIMSRFEVRKAVIPAAGLGTRFLPATKASPKEMLPLVDKPLIQYAVEEAVASGIEDIIIVTGRGKRAIEDHFDRSVELEENLKGSGKAQLLNQMRHISTLANFCYVRQSEALGLGHAVLCAQRLIGDEPFAVILGDEIIDAPVPGLAQLIHAYKKQHGAVLGVQEVPPHEVNRYGIVAPRTIAKGLHRVEGLIEKPAPAEAPSNLAVIGRYVLPPEIFSILRKTKPGKNGEIQLTDALLELAKKSPMFALEIQGQRYDAGDKLGFLIATVEFALKNPSLGPDFAEYLQNRMRPSGKRRATRSRKA
ncbi:MAG: UTP--glucose-1-phosphate uridylyltransferase [Nitrospira sp.]|nr:UTP--glucose-1-phosphate uridylyltransferase [Nitrospira sp.]